MKHPPAQAQLVRPDCSLVVSPCLAQLEDAFLAAVYREKSADAARAVTVIVGSNLQQIYLRRRLAAKYGAVANVRFYTLLDLAGEFFIQSSRLDLLKPLPEGTEGLLIRRIL